MRTTTKRGAGRAAGANGNGKSVFPPAPNPLITVYQQPPPEQRGPGSLAWKIARVTVFVIIAIAVGIAGGSALYVHATQSALINNSSEAPLIEKELHLPLPGRPSIALVVGYDLRAGETGGSRSDTIILLRGDPKTHTLSMMSFPRDLEVPIWCEGHELSSSDKINSAYARCGAHGIVSTIQHLTDLQINYVVAVGFHGFQEIVDHVGGVWINVDRRYYNKNTGSSLTDYSDINLLPGYRLLHGAQALQFARFRHTDSDFVRNARQQQTLKALKQQVSANLNPGEALKIVDAMKNNVKITSPDGKLPLKLIKNWAAFAYDLPPGHVFQTKIDVSSGYGVTASSEAIEQAVNDFTTPNVKAAVTANDSALGIKSKPKHSVKAPPPSKTTVTVLNGNGRAGAAATGNYLLGQRGYLTALPPSDLEANAPAGLDPTQPTSSHYYKTIIYYNGSKPGAKGAALAMTKLLAPAIIKRLPNNPELRALDPGVMLMPVLGSTFKNILTQAAPAPPPPRVPPEVRSTDDSLQFLKDRKNRVPFRLENPTVVEQNSYPDTQYGDIPGLLYTIDGDHKAIVLVYHNGNQYWNIMETDWNDAPALKDQSLFKRIKGRNYHFYYSGSHLHMIALTENGATYWVTNTLLDDLSNETMIAIAKGLRPLSPAQHAKPKKSRK